MKIILLGVLSTLAITTLPGHPKGKVENTEGHFLANNIKLNANAEGSSDPYLTKAYVLYNFDLDKVAYHTGHGNPDWYALYDTIPVTNVLEDDWRTVKYLSFENHSTINFYNTEIEYNPYNCSFEISFGSYEPIDRGFIKIHYQYHNSALDPNAKPDSYYNDINDDLLSEQSTWSSTDDSGKNNDTQNAAKKVYETGLIRAKININSGWDQFWQGIKEVDEDWYTFSTNWTAKYTFSFKGPNKGYYFELHKYSKGVQFTLSTTTAGKARTRTVTLCPGTYYMHVSCSSKDNVVDNQYEIDFKHSKFENNKVLLKPNTKEDYKMAVWTNDILSDRISDRFASTKFELYRHTSSKIKTETVGYVDPIITDKPILDSLLIIWGKDIYRGLMLMLDSHNKTYMKTLSDSDTNNNIQLRIENIDGIMQYVIQKGGQVLKKLGPVLDKISEISTVVSVAKAVISLVLLFFQKEYSATQESFIYGKFWQSLYDAAYYGSLDKTGELALYIPRYGSMVSEVKQADNSFIDFSQPRPSIVYTNYKYWKTTYFEPSLVYSGHPENNDYPYKCISQFQSIEHRDTGENKQTYHGSIKLIPNSSDISKYLHIEVPNIQ